MRTLKNTTIAALLGLAVLIPAGHAAAACPAIPENKVWGKVSAHTIARYVDAAYKGDWSAYIGKWEGRAAYARDLMSREATLVFHENNLWLRGDALAAYAGQIDERIQATRCLAGANADNRVSGETLAGSALNGGS
jgi:hypothetical protein